MSRGFQRTVCRALIGVLLLAQLALSAYACPALAAGARGTMPMPMPMATAAGGDAVNAATTAGERQMVRCEDMVASPDPDFANLCAEHCRHGQQSDQTATPAVPAAVLSALYVTPVPGAPVTAQRAAPQAPGAGVAAAPPLAILHCCFRI